MQTPNLFEVSYVLLDMDGTILDLHFDNYFWNHYLHRRYSEMKMVPLEKAITYIHETLAAEHGSLNWYCTDYWSRKFDLDIIALKKELSHLIQYREGSLKFLERLSKTSIKSTIVTNAHPDVIRLKNTLTRLETWVPNFISSHDFGVPKEKAEFWELVIQKRNLDISQTMVIDDNISCLEAARETGIAYQVSITKPDSKREKQVSSEFRAIEDLNSLFVEQ